MQPGQLENISGQTVDFETLTKDIPYVAPISPNCNPRVVILGEAPGSEEEIFGQPFFGASGKELKRMVEEAGGDWPSYYIDNLISYRPLKNIFPRWCVDEKPTQTGLFSHPITKGASNKRLWLNSAFHNHVSEKVEKIKALKPNIVIAVGAIPLWLCDPQHSGIKNSRGAIFWSDVLDCKCIGTYHPAAVLRDWSLRLTAVLDLRKAVKESAFPDVRYTPQQIWLDPTPDELLQYERDYLLEAKAKNLPVAVDIETAKGHITCVGFSVMGTHLAIVVPVCRQFTPSGQPGNYYDKEEDEIAAMVWLKRILEDPGYRCLFQNGVYDVQWLAEYLKIGVANFAEDTMLLAHAISPEMPKSLGYLGSVLTNAPSWKHLKPSGAEQKYGDE